MHDVIIIGGGPAGMTAAVYATRKNLRTLMLTKDIGGQTNMTLGVPGYAYQVLDGTSLVEKFYEQTSRFPIDLEEGEKVVSLVQIDIDQFQVSTEGGRNFKSWGIIIATGKVPNPLGVEGESEFIGKGITYCSTCDGPLFAGKKVAIVGEGDSAVLAADEMVKMAEHVYLVSTRLEGGPRLTQGLRAAGNFTTIPGAEVKRIAGQNFVEGIRIRDLHTTQETDLEVQGIFVEKGLIPGSNLVKGLLRLNDRGEIPVDHRNATEVPGLFAAGDVTDVFAKQLIVAAGEGAKAALQAHLYLQRLEAGHLE